LANIVIIGAGVMGTALSVPASDNGHNVLLVGTPLDAAIVKSLQTKRYHPGLQREFAESLSIIRHESLTAKHLADADIVVLGVSSAGVGWAERKIKALGVDISLLSLVTKGLEANDQQAPLTYAHTLCTRLGSGGVAVQDFVGIGGPCIAVEIVDRHSTSVVYASENQKAMTYMQQCMQTPHYRISLSHDLVGVEACAAIKNFLAIGVSATLASGVSQEDKSSLVSMAKNPTAAAFNQAVREMAILSHWIGGERDTAFDLAGMGDLHVTVGGGRNSRLGKLLGMGMLVSEALEGPLDGVTVEGKDTGLVLAPAIKHALSCGALTEESLPLTLSILASIENDAVLDLGYPRSASALA